MNTNQNNKNEIYFGKVQKYYLPVLYMTLKNKYKNIEFNNEEIIYNILLSGVTIKISYRIIIHFNKVTNKEYLKKEIYKLINKSPVFSDDRFFDKNNGIYIYFKEDFHISNFMNGIDTINDLFIKKMEILVNEIENKLGKRI